MAALLIFGDLAYASHVTAAAIEGMISKRWAILHVTLPHGRERVDRDGIIVHQARTLSRGDTQTLNGIRVTSPHRTLVDLAGMLPLRELEAALDAALLAGLVSVPSLRRYIRDRRLTHNRGVGCLRRLVDDRAAGAMQSRIERDFLQIVRDAGLPEPVRQYRVGSRKIDFAYPEARIAIELDHVWTHGSAAALRDDDRRQNMLVLNGWTPLRFTEDDLTRPEDVEALLRRALARDPLWTPEWMDGAVRPYATPAPGRS